MGDFLSFPLILSWFSLYRSKYYLYTCYVIKYNTITNFPFASSSAKVDSRILSLTINPNGLIVKGNPVDVTLRPISLVSRTFINIDHRRDSS